MTFLAWILRFLALCLRIVPVKRRVAFLSRQSKTPSLDYRMLVARLREQLGEHAVVMCLCEPETGNVASFALGTVRQLYYARTSSVVVVDGYVPAVCVPRKDRRVCVIQLWHALGAVKRFGYQCLDTPAGRTGKQARIARMHRNYDCIVAGGPGAIDAYASAFDYPPERIEALGLPRMDYLLESGEGGWRAGAMRSLAERFPFLREGKRIVLYAPTLRKGAGYEANWLSAYTRELAGRVCGPDTLLVVAAHPLSGTLEQSVLDECPHVRSVCGVPTIDVLGFADVVVTDYSAVAFEAALLGKRVEFFTPDIERYRRSPGLNVQPEDMDAAFFRGYFSGVQAGATQRIVDFICGKLHA